jgi:hypothetical protein
MNVTNRDTEQIIMFIFRIKFEVDKNLISFWLFEKSGTR